MSLLALNIAIGVTITAFAGLAAERVCAKQAIAFRHALLFACMIVIAATPPLAFLAQRHGIGVLRPWTAMVETAKANGVAPINGIGSTAVLFTSNSLSNSGDNSATILADHSLPAALILECAIDALLIVWAIGILSQFLRLARSWLLLRRLSCTVEDVRPEIHRLALRASRRLGLRAMPKIAQCASAPSPLVMGLFNPCIILPSSATALAIDELEAVLLHELAHVARRDQWAGLLASIEQVCFWWCMPVALLLRRLGDLREQLCDAHVVSEQGHGLNLAAALVAVCEGSMRARFPLAPVAALSAGGNSRRTLRNRIQILTNQENRIMIRTSHSARFAVGAFGLLMAGVVALINIRPVPASAAVELASLPPTIRMLSEGDFWTKTGAATKHDFDAETVSELEKVVRTVDHPDLSLRAAKLLCDHAGHSRLNAKLSDADNALAVRVAFSYLESHLADAEVAKYAPARGFSHMTISQMGNDGEGVAWVLIETAQLPPSFNGGLNIRVDLKASKVTTVKQWGDVRPAPAK